jgi:hypothetical protein
MRFAALFATCLTASSAAAGGELAETQGGSVDLGAFQGIVYYTSDADGYRVVTTLASGAQGSPVRFVTTLTESQTFEISVPGRVGEAARALQISRANGRLFVSDAEANAETARLEK